MTTIDIYNNIKYLSILNEINMEIKSVSTDTRNIENNATYFGIKGTNFDGNKFYMDAFKKGATIAVLDDIEITDEIKKYLEENNKSIIIVPDTIKALGELARYKRSIFKNPVIAITGSTGKTSTKDMIYSVLKEKYNVQKTQGNQNNHIGLPLTILALDEKTDILVLEMGMNHVNEISYLTSIAKPDIAVITNIGTAHIGNLGSRENILKAKLEILEGLNEFGTCIINNDNDLLHDWYMLNNEKVNITTIGFKNESDYQALNIQENADGSEFDCHNNHIKVPIGGEHFIYNSLVAIAIGNIYHLDFDEIQKGIKNCKLTQNRMQTIKNEQTNITIINDSYNASFDSLRYGIKYLASLTGRKIAVIGTMLELGEFAEELHTNIGDIIVEEKIDILITVGEYTNFINERAISLGFNEQNSYHYTNNKEAINKINEIKTKDDVILVKASYALNFKEIVDNII